MKTREGQKVHGPRRGHIPKNGKVKVNLSTENQGGEKGRGIGSGTPQAVEQAIRQSGPDGENGQGPSLMPMLGGKEHRTAGFTDDKFTGEFRTRSGCDAARTALPENDNAAP